MKVMVVTWCVVGVVLWIAAHTAELSDALASPVYGWAYDRRPLVLQFLYASLVVGPAWYFVRKGPDHLRHWFDFIIATVVIWVGVPEHLVPLFRKWFA